MSSSQNSNTQLTLHSGSTRPQNYIFAIKSLRVLTSILGKLGISSLVIDYHDIFPPPIDPAHSRLPLGYSRYRYGLGLKEAKDLMDRYLSRKAAAAPATATGIGIVEDESGSV